MTEREKRIREEIATTVENILAEGGTERLLEVIRGEGDLNPLLAKVLVQSRDWEQDSDTMIEYLLQKVPLPGWVPFVEGFARKRLDRELPELVLNPVLEKLLIQDGVTPDRTINLYGYMKRGEPDG